MRYVNGVSSDPPIPRLRVMTQNLWGWYFPTPPSGVGYARSGKPPPAWTARNTVLMDGLRQLSPDIIAFQEAIRTPSFDQVQELLGPSYHVVHQRTRQDDGSGASIASRWPIRAVHEVDLHVTDRTTGSPRATLIAEIEAPAPFGRLLLANHVPDWELDFEHERELQAVAAARAIKALVDGTGTHTVVAGDFNVDLDSASMRFWTGRQSLHGISVSYTDAWSQAHPGDPGHTVSPHNPVRSRGTWPQDPGAKIDHILIRCVNHGPTLAVASCTLAFNEPTGGTWASDHFGVVADLLTPPPTPEPSVC
jgi:endonuclease/exonuclease/phosphatase family metal-dependent hydrolase